MSGKDTAQMAGAVLFGLIGLIILFLLDWKIMVGIWFVCMGWSMAVEVNIRRSQNEDRSKGS